MGIFSSLFDSSSPELLNCNRCSRSMSSANIKKVAEALYYVDCSCGMIADHGDSPESAAANWNLKVKAGVPKYQPWTPMPESTGKFLVFFKYQDTDMYEQAETEAEARTSAIRLSKTYGRAQITNSTEPETLFVNGNPVVDDGQPT